MCVCVNSVAQGNKLCFSLVTWYVLPSMKGEIHLTTHPYMCEFLGMVDVGAGGGVL